MAYLALLAYLALSEAMKFTPDPKVFQIWIGPNRGVWARIGYLELEEEEVEDSE